MDKMLPVARRLILQLWYASRFALVDNVDFQCGCSCLLSVKQKAEGFSILVAVGTKEFFFCLKACLKLIHELVAHALHRNKNISRATDKIVLTNHVVSTTKRHSTQDTDTLLSHISHRRSAQDVSVPVQGVRNKLRNKL